MKKKIKISLILSLAIIFGCFSNVFAATNQNNKVKKIAEVKKSVRLIQNATTDDGAEIGTSNLNGTADNSAKVGDQLTSPEIGWKRYDDANNKIVYGGMWTSVNTSTWYKGTSSYVPLTFAGIAKVDFKFYGTKFRIISNSDSSAYASGQQVFIDGVNVGGYSQKSFSTPQTLLYESATLTLGTHKVELVAPSYINSSLFRLSLDAIDIDSTGYLIDSLSTPTTGISLNKTTDSLTAGNTDSLTATVKPDNATNKTVKWTSSDPNIVSVDDNGNITAGTKAGTATITATTTDGSNLSASCEVTVKDQEPSKSKLTLYMNDKTTREFYLTQDEIDNFIDWYTSKIKGEVTVQPYYVFNVSVPEKSSAKKSYVWFMKIESFEVE